MERFSDLNGYDMEDVMEVWTSSPNHVRKSLEMSSILYDAVDSSDNMDVLYRWIGGKKDKDPVYKVKVGGEVRYDLISTTTEDFHNGVIPYDNEDGSMGFFYNNCKTVLEIRGAKGYRIPNELSNGYGSQNEVITYGLFVLESVRDDFAEWHDNNSNKDKSKSIKVYELRYVDDESAQESYRNELQESKGVTSDPIEFLVEKGMLTEESDWYVAHFPSREQALRDVSSLEDYDECMEILVKDGSFILPMKEWNGWLSFRYLKSWNNFPTVINGDVDIVSDIGTEGCPIVSCSGECNIR